MRRNNRQSALQSKHTLHQLENLEARYCMAADDWAELNAAEWGTFASDQATTSIVDDRARKFVGEASLLFQTADVFDTGVTYPKSR